MNLKTLFSVFLPLLFVMSCDKSLIGSEQTSAAGVIQSASLTGSGVQVDHSVITTFLEKVQNLSKIEINSLTDSEIFDLGAPLQMLTDFTYRLPDESIELLDAPIARLFENGNKIGRSERDALSGEITNIFQSTPGYLRSTKVFSADLLRSLFLDFISSQNHFSLCRVLFDVTDEGVIIITSSHSSYPMGGLGFANQYCPSGSSFLLMAGTHTNSKVVNSRRGNTWIGLSGTVVDGQDRDDMLFHDGMDYNYISGFKIRNYVEQGIRSQEGWGSKGVTITFMEFENIGKAVTDSTYQEYGAIKFTYSEDITVSYSYFEDVAQSVRINDSSGPIQIIGNEALNSGRGFFQCGSCSGGNIDVRDNSMVHTSQYGSVPLEDWINFFNSSGLSNNPIQVIHNRAWGHSNSAYGSFIQLGDAGGKYQEAKNNIGVNPGQAGIAGGGGDYITFEDNKLYSEQWSESNVGFGSRNHTYFDPSYTFQTCSNHAFRGNLANWTNKNGVQNPSWAPPVSEYPDKDSRCGIDLDDIRDEGSVDDDPSIDEDIWDEW